MSNILTFSSPYKSLYRFETATLPKFVVLTGRNGSGKTHLLEAIREGNIRSSLANNSAEEVRFFTATTIVPSDTGRFDPSQEQSQRSQFFQIMEAHRGTSFPALQSFAIQQGIPPEHCSSVRKIASLSASELQQFIPDLQRAVQVENAIKTQVTALASQIYTQSYNQIGDPHWRRAAQRILQSRPESFLTDSQSSFLNEVIMSLGRSTPSSKPLVVFSQAIEI